MQKLYSLFVCTRCVVILCLFVLVHMRAYSQTTDSTSQVRLHLNSAHTSTTRPSYLREPLKGIIHQIPLAPFRLSFAIDGTYYTSRDELYNDRTSVCMIHARLQSRELLWGHLFAEAALGISHYAIHYVDPQPERLGDHTERAFYGDAIVGLSSMNWSMFYYNEGQFPFGMDVWTSLIHEPSLKLPNLHFRLYGMIRNNERTFSLRAGLHAENYWHLGLFAEVRYWIK